MGMQIDEAGTDEPVTDVDLEAGFRRDGRGDRRDPIGLDGDVGRESERPRPVHHLAVPQDQIEHSSSQSPGARLREDTTFRPSWTT